MAERRAKQGRRAAAEERRQQRPTARAPLLLLLLLCLRRRGEGSSSGTKICEPRRAVPAMGLLLSLGSAFKELQTAIEGRAAPAMGLILSLGSAFKEDDIVERLQNIPTYFSFPLFGLRWHCESCLLSQNSCARLTSRRRGPKMLLLFLSFSEISKFFYFQLVIWLSYSSLMSKHICCSPDDVVLCIEV